MVVSLIVNTRIAARRAVVKAKDRAMTNLEKAKYLEGFLRKNRL
jgi:hypothetical protein